MTLTELLEALSDPCLVDEGVDVMEMQVQFLTKNRSNLTLLSVYVSNGQVCIDIGDDDD